MIAPDLVTVQFPPRDRIISFLEQNPGTRDQDKKVINAVAEYFADKKIAPLGIHMGVNLTLGTLKISCEEKNLHKMRSDLATALESFTNRKSFPIEKICELLNEMDLFDIELIGMDICDSILKNLGPKGVLKVARLMLSKKTLQPHERMILALKIKDAENADPFLSFQENHVCNMEMLTPVKNKIREAFKNPRCFLEEGVEFVLSDYMPTKLLTDVFKKINRELLQFHIPTKYCVKLTIDRELTDQKSELYFKLSEVSEKIEFSKRSFSLSELKNEFLSDLP